MTRYSEAMTDRLAEALAAVQQAYREYDGSDEKYAAYWAADAEYEAILDPSAKER